MIIVSTQSPLGRAFFLISHFTQKKGSKWTLRQEGFFFRLLPFEVLL